MRIHRRDDFHNEMPKGIQSTDYMTVFFCYTSSHLIS